jgi:hypothetical protein
LDEEINAFEAIDILLGKFLDMEERSGIQVEAGTVFFETTEGAGVTIPGDLFNAALEAVRGGESWDQTPLFDFMSDYIDQDIVIYTDDIEVISYKNR